jgi:HK97 family phage portal protein
VNLIAGAISTLPCAVSRETADGIPEDVPNHPLNRILQVSPNYDQTPIDFFDFMQTALELEGDAIALKIRGASGQIIGLDPLIPSNASRKRLANGKIEYRWTKDNRTFVETDENVLHIRGPGGHPLGGLSTLSYARDTFGLARSAERVQSRMMRNGVRPTLALTFPTWLTKEQREQGPKLVEKFSGIENSGKPVILEGGTKVDKLTIDPVDAEILMTRGFTVEEVCRFFAVPPVMIGHTSKTTSWPAGVEQQFLLFLKLCLRRRIKRIEQAMEKQLLTPMEFARGLRIRFNFEALLRADSAARASFYQIMRQIGGLTINEIRKLEGRPPVAGGDTVLVQMQDIPISQAGKQNKPAVAAPQEDDDDED